MQNSFFGFKNPVLIYTAKMFQGIEGVGSITQKGESPGSIDHFRYIDRFHVTSSLSKIQN